MTYSVLFHIRVLATGAVSDRIPPALHLFRNFPIPEDDKKPEENAQFPPVSKPQGESQCLRDISLICSLEKLVSK